MRKHTLFAAMAITIMTLGVAGTAQAQQHGNNANNGNRNVFQQRGSERRGPEVRGGEFRNPGVNRDFRNERNDRDRDHRDYGRDYRGDYGRDYRGDYGRDYRGDYGRDYRGYGWGRGGIDIYIGGGRFGYPNGYASTRIIYEVVQERVYDDYEGRWVFTGRTYSVSHVATWDNYYRGYVWYDSNGQLRVN